MASKKTGLGDKPVIVTPKQIKASAMYSEIAWLSKKKRGYSKFDESKDIRIAFGKHVNKKTGRKEVDALNFSFRNHIEQVWGKEKQNIIFGIVNNRLYFKAVDANEGYRINIRANTSCLSMTISKEEKAALEPFVGKEYHLKYDDFQELYYIEREEQ